MWRMEAMRMWFLVRAMTRLWEWATPGLIALEPAAMALHVASREMGVSPRAARNLPIDILRVVKVQSPSQTGRNQLRVEGLGK
jgi:hypothetical protein